MCAFLQTDNILWPQVRTVFAVVLLRVAAAASQLPPSLSTVEETSYEMMSL